MDIKSIKLKKGMNKEDVNKLIYKWVLLEDEVYKGINYKHNWICPTCKNVMHNKMWDNIRVSKVIKCNDCLNNDREIKYKSIVEKDGEYEYIRRFRKGDVLPNGKIVGDSPYVEIKHKFCDSIYTMRIADFKNGRRCYRCCNTYENSFAHHIEVELKLDINKIWDFDKNNLNPYCISKNYNGKVWIKCQNEEINKLNGLKKKDYHKSYEISCNSFIRGSRCSYCSMKKIHPLDSFGYHHFDKVMSWHQDNEISPFKIGKYSHKTYKFVCLECKNIFYKSVTNVTFNNSWCPQCSMSKGEKKIVEWLRYNNIKYEYEKTYNGLVGLGGGLLSYDFYLPDYNLLIEYQGKQHEEYTCLWHNSYEDFEKQLEHDKRKREYANNNGIKLIEIYDYEKHIINEVLNERIQ